MSETNAISAENSPDMSIEEFHEAINEHVRSHNATIKPQIKISVMAMSPCHTGGTLWTYLSMDLETRYVLGVEVSAIAPERHVPAVLRTAVTELREKRAVYKVIVPGNVMTAALREAAEDLRVQIVPAVE
jgi:hypothetical protein